MPEVHIETEWLHDTVPLLGQVARVPRRERWAEGRHPWTDTRLCPHGENAPLPHAGRHRDHRATSTSAFSPTTIVARTALGGSGILGRGALLHARRLEYKKMQRPFPPARGGMGRGAWTERTPCRHVSGTLRGDRPDRLAL